MEAALYSQLIFCILLNFLIATFADLPPGIPKCKSSNNDDCIAKSMMKVMELYAHGSSDIGLPDVTALKQEKLVLADGKNNSPMQLNFILKNVVVTGLEKFQAKRVHGFDRNLTKTLEFDILIPKLSLAGDYEMMGKLLLFPLNGHGKGQIHFINIIFKFKVTVSLESRSNKNYGVIEKFKLWDSAPEKMILKLENIVDNNGILTESINEVINENWKDVWQEFKKNTIQISENVVKNIVKGVLNVLSIDDFYLN